MLFSRNGNPTIEVGHGFRLELGDPLHALPAEGEVAVAGLDGDSLLDDEITGVDALVEPEDGAADFFGLAVVDRPER